MLPRADYPEYFYQILAQYLVLLLFQINVPVLINDMFDIRFTYSFLFRYFYKPNMYSDPLELSRAVLPAARWLQVHP